LISKEKSQQQMVKSCQVSRQTT